MKVEITRNTFWDGKPYEVGQVVDLSDRQAEEMMANGKAKPHAEPQAPIINRAIELETSDEKVTKRQWRKKPSQNSTAS